MDVPWNWSAIAVATCIAALDVTAIVKVMRRGGDVEGTLAWIFSVIAFPAIGAIAYLILSGPSLHRTIRRRRSSNAQVRASGVIEPAHLARSASVSDTVLKTVVSLTGMPATLGNLVVPLIDADHAFQALETAIERATRRVHAEYYIVRNDETGRRFLDLLTRQAAAGVEVRFLYDAMGSFGLDSGRLDALRRAGARVEAFLPLSPWRRRWAVQQRNHRKIVIVDDTVAFTGGMNVGNEYSGRVRRRGDLLFRDSHVQIDGPAVADLAQVFREDWAFATGEALDPPQFCGVPQGAARVGIVPSGPDQSVNANSMVYFASINAARQHVSLTSPYFIPDSPTMRALMAAALRGVDVRILVPARCDVWLVGMAARTYYRPLLAAGVRIFEYERSMLHAKTIVVDDEFCVVGSANVDVRSFRLNYELSAAVADEAFARDMERRFQEDLEHSREVTSRTGRNAAWWRRLRDQVARLLSPLL
ncbi:MAG: cardiolipin synthase [Planctomycetes bacterium]|nr:cardiolipin synthase [Planctomycetota bacterium]MCC7172834.1 cardiolipin synthase [Planctomycetota bacterium]